MSTQVAEFDVASAIYTPQEASTYAVEAIQRTGANKLAGFSLGIPGIPDDYFAPVLPGQVCAIVAQTSQYKSGFLHCIERMGAQRLMDDGRDKEIIVHVSVEECIEEQIYLELARESGETVDRLTRADVQDWDRLMKSAIKVGTIPIYRIGDSLARADDMPNLYMSNMIRAIEHLQTKLLDWKPKIAAIMFDYLQAFPIDPEIRSAGFDQQRRLQVRSDTYRLRLAAAKFRCPVYVAVQAKQILSAPQTFQMPGIYDGEETSSIAQRFDRMICLWMPKMTHTIGSMVKHNTLEFKVDENLLFVKIAKQRGGLPSGRIYQCRVDFSNNSIAVETSAEDEPTRNNWSAGGGR